MKRSLTALAALAVVAGLGGYVATRGDEALVTPALAQDAAASDTAEATEAAMAPDYSLGSDDAPIELIEYASFTCSHCAHFHDTVFGDLKKDYIDTGKVKFTLREVYFDKYGLIAGQIARCGGEMRYWGLTDMIFEQQGEWIAGGDGSKIEPNLRKLGKVAGLTDEMMDACIADEALAMSMVEAYQVHATADNIEGTPSLVINGQLYSNMSYADLKKILDDKLAEAGN